VLVRSKDNITQWEEITRHKARAASIAEGRKKILPYFERWAARSKDESLLVRLLAGLRQGYRPRSRESVGP
jgi:hypothetical protein